MMSRAAVHSNDSLAPQALLLAQKSALTGAERIRLMNRTRADR